MDFFNAATEQHNHPTNGTSTSQLWKALSSDMKSGLFSHVTISDMIAGIQCRLARLLAPRWRHHHGNADRR
ncbi:hypothetical protein RRG08_027987 [Elysia crispata]|uniref:Uncharacterized protein n=1 Tax=Elysia crispata TaxID=231223 RepID=A0AAE1BC13_9GAST|nr:hypothetical protein RRG08_027987 [Elysia crispata]